MDLPTPPIPPFPHSTLHQAWPMAVYFIFFPKKTPKTNVTGIFEIFVFQCFTFKTNTYQFLYCK